MFWRLNLFFKERFESLAFFQKIEVVLIILIVYGGVLYYVDSFYSFDQEKKLKQQTLKNIDITNKIDISTQSEALQYIQDKLIVCNIDNSSIVVQNSQKISLEFISAYKNSFKLLSTIEKYFKILSLSIVPKEQLLEVQLVLDTKYIFDKNMTKHLPNSLEDPFYYKKEKIKEVIVEKKEETFKIPKYQVDGILGDEVLINQQWYLKGDVIENNKVLDIKNNTIFFQNIINKKQFEIKYDN